MAITYNIEVTKFLDAKTNYVRADGSNVELFPDSLLLQDGQRDQRIEGDLGLLNLNDLFGHEGSNWVAFLTIANETLPANPRIAVERVREVPDGSETINDDGDPLYLYQVSTGTLDRVKYNAGIVPEGFVLRLSAVDEDLGNADIIGPWQISITVARMRTVEDYNAVCVLG